ncbi:MAG: tRNA preQ1(34) S-adenosylmethionine ribosyltransferase-isomerase QueA [Myxococcota bacterium]
MDRTDLDYELPEERIAQRPLPDRDAARLLVLDRPSGALRHAHVRDLPTLVPPALWVVNDTRVLPARLIGERPTGGRTELLLVERVAAEGPAERWLALGRPAKRLRPGTSIRFGEGALVARVIGRREEGEIEVELRASGEGSVGTALEQVGQVPLPPYIQRAPEPADRERYQTVFATRPGAVAAPTAGLHLSERLIDALEGAGHRFARVTLHVGPGTFQPVQAEDLAEHRMHAERYAVSERAAEAVARAKAEGRPVVAVGTTVVRTLESAVDASGAPTAGEGSTRLFIRPPYPFRVVDTLLTNFHLPGSTLLALVMAMGGVREVRQAYAEAVREGYRFFSYGDAMLIRGGAA